MTTLSQLLQVARYSAELLIDARATAAEAPLWDDSRDGLWWCDIRRPSLHFWSMSRPAKMWDMPSVIGFVALDENNAVVVGLADGLHLFEPESGAMTFLFHPEPELPDSRLNEGRVDHQGRLWFGTMQDKGLTTIGSLWCWAPGSDATRVFSNVQIPNGLSFDKSTGHATFADNGDRRILRFPVDDPAEATTFLAPDGAPGEPDGCAIDAAGNVWNARFGAGCVVRITPDGEVDQIVDVPAANVAGICFGGPKRDNLVITTLRVRMSAADLVQMPLSGGLFTHRPDIAGAPEPRMKPISVNQPTGEPDT